MHQGVFNVFVGDSPRSGATPSNPTLTCDRNISEPRTFLTREFRLGRRPELRTEILEDNDNCYLPAGFLSGLYSSALVQMRSISARKLDAVWY